MTPHAYRSKHGAMVRVYLGARAPFAAVLEAGQALLKHADVKKPGVYVSMGKIVVHAWMEMDPRVDFETFAALCRERGWEVGT